MSACWSYSTSTCWNNRKSWNHISFHIMYYNFSRYLLLLFNSFKQFSDGTTDTVTPMWITLGANILNIIELFPYIRKMRSSGIDWRNCRYFNTGKPYFDIGCILHTFARCSRYKEYLKGSKTELSTDESIQSCTDGASVGFQMGVETGSFSLSVIMMGWIGSIALAAHQVLGVITTLDSWYIMELLQLLQYVWH